MPFLQLADDVVLDTADGSAVILDTVRGTYFGLNPTATLMLEAALRFDTGTEVVSHLRSQVDATGDVLHNGLRDLSVQLAAQNLIKPTDVGNG